MKLSVSYTGNNACDKKQNFYRDSSCNCRKAGVSSPIQRIVAPDQKTIQRPVAPTKFLEYAFELKKRGRTDSTIRCHVERLQRLDRMCNIEDPEQVRAILATQEWSNAFKQNMSDVYNCYLKFKGKTWNQPKYKRESKLYFIPTEKELDSLISAGRSKTATYLQFLKETGARMGEAIRLQWKDIDTERKTVYIRAEKGSNSRLARISPKLLEMLQRQRRIDEYVFQATPHGIRVTFMQLRNSLAEKLANPRLRQITLHTFRHYKATMEYHKTKDIIHVKQMLGHKNIVSTMVYINIENSIFTADSDEWTSKVSRTIEEDQQLIDTGFEYVTERDELKLYRKRK